MTRIKWSSTILFLLFAASPLRAVELKQGTLSAWGDYIRSVDTASAERNNGSRPFLWMDESSEIQQRVRVGEIVVTNLYPPKVPQGMIHHWAGDLFVPGVSIDQVMRVMNSYDRYTDVYKPLIRKSAVAERDGDTVILNVLAAQKAFSVTAAVESDEVIQIARPAVDRVSIMADAVRIQEICDYGRPDEHVFPEAQRPGYVWRAQIVQRLEERDGGVYVELETISLSRAIPVEVRWLIKRMTDDLPRQMMTNLLDETRSAARRSAAGQ